jgi:FkbM family methyltransferase
VNLGQTLMAVKAIEPGRRYVGVEPNPACIAYVERLIAINEFSDCAVVPVGLDCSAGIRKLQFYSESGFDESASLVDGFRPEQPISAIKLVPTFPFATIEEVIGPGNLGLVKIDVEGGESAVMTSMRVALQRDRPWLCVEILPCYSPDNVRRVERQNFIETMLNELNYAKFRVRKSAGNRFGGLDPIAEIGIHSNLSWSDYVFYPVADAEQLMAVNSLNFAAGKGQ